MPARTSADVPRETATHFKFIDVKGFLLLVFEYRCCGSAAAAITHSIVTSASISDHREHLKLIWRFSEAADSIVRQGSHRAYGSASVTLNLSIYCLRPRYLGRRAPPTPAPCPPRAP